MKKQVTAFLGLIALATGAVYSQSTTFGLGPAGHLGGTAATDWCGWNGATTIPFNLQHRGTENINFFTGGAGLAFQRMTILGTASANPGFVGIATPAPTQRLEVGVGNINIFTNSNAYMLGGQNILWHKGNPRNIFVGVGAGANHIGAASYNSYLGYNAGFTGTGSAINSQNTIIGGEAGFNNDGPDNVFVGYRAAFGISGFNTNGLTAIGTFAGETGSQNGETVFVGYKAGQSTNSFANCFVGFNSGINSTTGSNNSFFGTNSGAANQAHNNNTYIGRSSGANSNGNSNTCVGGFSGTSGVGSRNVLLGYNTMSAATSGRQNVIIGSDANSTTTGNDFNTMVGTDAGIANTTGARNTFIGYQTAINQTTGDYNAYLGTNTGNNITSGNNNTFIGGNANATSASSNLNNAAAIGANAQVTNNDHMILGDNNVNVGIGLSADATGPQNKLEINTAATSAVPGASGLRFRDLTSSSTPQPNLGSGVLSVDANGDVIYVSSPAGIGLGNVCGGSSNPLSNSWEIPMAGFNFNFTDLANSQSSFHIGNPACSATVGRLNVYNDNLQVGGVFNSNLNTASNSFGVFSNITNSGNGQLLAVQGTANSSGTGSTARGVRGEAIAANGNIAEGVKGIASTNNNCQQNIAVGGLAANGSVLSLAGDFDVEQSNSPLNQGVNVEVINGNNLASTNFGINTFVRNAGVVNYGGFFSAGSASQNIGVYGDAGGSISGLPPTPGQANLAGYFNGDVYISGAFGPSDQNLKENIDTIVDALNIIQQLKPKSFDYKHSSYPSMNLPNGKQYGLIAQDVEAIIPELVSNNTQPAKIDSVGNVVIAAVNFKGLEYQQLIPFLIKGMQEQQAQIKKQDSLIAALSNQINSCCSNTNTARQSNSTINQMDIELSDKDVIVLNQNVPNPFAEQTTITYNVPASVGKAQLIFFNTNGQVIQTVDIKTRGKGKVNVFASDLSSGLYNYTLVADGKVIDSKKMVRE